MRRLGAEFIGTFSLVIAGCGAVMVNSQTGALDHIGIAVTFGLIITVMIASVGHISGAHFNPAVTLAFAITRHFRWNDAIYYIIAQTLGAICGALMLRLLVGDMAGLGATVPVGSILQSFGIEVLLTAMLMFVIVAVATDRAVQGLPASLAIGFTVMLGALWGGPISGASMNPARSFGPALIAGIWDHQWIYWIAPILGAMLGATIYQRLREY